MSDSLSVRRYKVFLLRDLRILGSLSTRDVGSNNVSEQALESPEGADYFEVPEGA